VLVRSTALVPPYYGSGLDADCGPCCLQVCSYCPDTAKLCRKGHEYLQRQWATEGIAVAALDTGIRSCDDPARLHALADTLAAARIEALVRKGLALLPHP